MLTMLSVTTPHVHFGMLVLQKAINLVGSSISDLNSWAWSAVVLQRRTEAIEVLLKIFSVKIVLVVSAPCRSSYQKPYSLIFRGYIAKYYWHFTNQIIIHWVPISISCLAIARLPNCFMFARDIYS